MCMRIFRLNQLFFKVMHFFLRFLIQGFGIKHNF
jgi:hypothetical protein